MLVGAIKACDEDLTYSSSSRKFYGDLTFKVTIQRMNRNEQCGGMEAEQREHSR